MGRKEVVEYLHICTDEEVASMIKEARAIKDITLGPESILTADEAVELALATFKTHIGDRET